VPDINPFKVQLKLSEELVENITELEIVGPGEVLKQIPFSNNGRSPELVINPPDIALAKSVMDGSKVFIIIVLTVLSTFFEQLAMSNTVNMHPVSFSFQYLFFMSYLGLIKCQILRVKENFFGFFDENTFYQIKIRLPFKIFSPFSLLPLII